MLLILGFWDLSFRLSFGRGVFYHIDFLSRRTRILYCDSYTPSQGIRGATFISCDNIWVLESQTLRNGTKQRKPSYRRPNMAQLLPRRRSLGLWLWVCHVRLVLMAENKLCGELLCSSPVAYRHHPDKANMACNRSLIWKPPPHYGTFLWQGDWHSVPMHGTESL